MPTIRDVAERAGVSVSTVSLVLNKKKNVSDEKYAKVMAAIKELNYRPSIIAQNLKRQHFHMIGVVLPTNEGVYAQMLRGIHDAAEAGNYDLLVKFSGSSKTKEKEYLERFVSMGVTGIVTMPCDVQDTETYQRTVDAGVPMVFLERKIPHVDIPSVTFNNSESVRKATKKALEKYKPSEIALITGSSRYKDEADCQDGFAEAIQEKYPDISRSQMEVTETSFERKRCIYTLLDRYCGKDKEIKCFIVSSFRMAEVLREIEAIIKDRPEIYALTGDVWFPERDENPEIYRIPREAANLGKEAAKLLIRQITARRPAEVNDVIIEDRYSLENIPSRLPVKSSGRKKIRALLLKTNDMDILSRLAVNFTKETGIEVEFEFESFETISSVVLGHRKNIEKYDILWCDYPFADILIDEGKVADRSEFMSEEDEAFFDMIPEGIRKCIYRKNKSYSVFPIMFSETVLFYRESVFKDNELKREFYNKFGIELRLPTTWPEFNMVAEFFDSRSNPNSRFKYGTAMSLISYTFMEEFYMRQWAYKGRIFDSRKRQCINSTENLRALKSFKDSWKHAHPDSLNLFYDDAFHSLLLGEIPMTVGFSVHYLPFRSSDVDEDIEKDIRVTTVPGGRPITGGWVFGINSASNKKREAFEFIKWSLRPDTAVIRDLTGSIVPVGETFTNPMLNNTVPALSSMDMNNFSKGIRESILDPWGATVNQYLIEKKVKVELQKALTDEVTAEEALQNASDAIDSFLKEKRK